jgi:hypothetical protein
LPFSMPAVHFSVANTITTFNVSGICQPNGPLKGTTYSGTLAVDVIAGTVTAMDVRFQGLSPFTTINESNPSSTSDWGMLAGSDESFVLELTFTTGHTPGSLVGFTGGTITGDEVIQPDTGLAAYEIFNGSMTAVVPARLPDEGRH